jgi:hypothetical protein
MGKTIGSHYFLKVFKKGDEVSSGSFRWLEMASVQVTVNK